MQKPKQTLPKQTHTIPPPSSNTNNTTPITNLNTPININPWTNKIKIRGEGLLNSIMDKYLNDDDGDIRGKVVDSRVREFGCEDYERQYIQLAEKIRSKYQVRNRIEQNMKPLFQLQERCSKIDQLLQWLQKIQTRKTQKQPNPPPQPQQSTQNQNLKPIDTSFIYLPLHSETIFHEILSDCINQNKGKGLGQYRNMKLKGKIEEINQICGENFGEMLERNVL